MIGRCAKPAASRAVRIAPTRPSIMSEGAITSDPAPGHDEERLHELGRVDARLAHQAAERLAAAETARAVGGEAAHDGACIKASERGLWKRPSERDPRRPCTGAGAPSPLRFGAA